MPFNDITKDFRKEIWKTLIDSYEQYSIQILSIIKNFKPGYQEPIKEILEHDLTFLLPFIESKLDPVKFEDIYFVHEFVNWLNRIELSDRTYQKLKETFYSKEFEYFRKLDWNRVKGKQDYDFEKYEDFQKLKEEDIRASFVFKEEKEFNELHKAITNTLSIEDNNGWGIYQSLDIIVEENFNKNEEIGFKLLESILSNYPKGMNPLYKSLTAIEIKSPEWALRLWNVLKAWENENQVYWKLTFFDCLPNEFANESYKNQLLETYSTFTNHIGYLRFESVAKYLPIDEGIIHKALKIIVDKIEQQNLRITYLITFLKFIRRIFLTTLRY